MLRLRITPPKGQPYEYVSEATSLVIGRVSAADLVLPDPLLSRRHARLFRRDQVWFVEDLGSRKTTLLNGAAVERPVPVRVGDTLNVARTVVRVQAAEAAPVEPSALEQTVFRSASELIRIAESRDSAEIEGEAALRRYAERLKLLNEVHRALAGPSSVQELLELILERAFSHLDPEEGAIFVRSPDGTLTRAVSRRLPELEGELLDSRRLAAEVVDKGLAALVTDALRDERFATAKSIVGSGVRSLLAAPLLDPQGVLGMIVLGSRCRERCFCEDDLELLVSLASVAALRLRNAALSDEAARRRQLERDLALAREIQIGLLPKGLPQLAGYALRATTLPSRTVSGDFYKVVLRPKARECLFMVVDVAGKGLTAALLTASIEALSAGPIDAGLAPGELCVSLSRYLHLRTPPERFATAFVGALELDTGVLRYASAGHDPTLVLRQRGPWERLSATGIPLGLMESAAYSTEQTCLGPGDSLLVCTDGLTEATDSGDREYGVLRLLDVARMHAQETPDELATALERDLDAFVGDRPYADDRTLLVLKRLLPSPA
jgi:sigma-B regulation protein RsbU (phosphoserine phosphatase)